MIERDLTTFWVLVCWFLCWGSVGLAVLVDALMVEGGNMKDRELLVRRVAAYLYGHFGVAAFRPTARRHVVEARADRFHELPPFFQDRHLAVAADLVERIKETEGVQ